MSTTTTTTSDQIHDLGSRWVDAELAGDVPTLAEMVTEDFRLVGPFGFVLDKDQWLDRYRSGDFATTALRWHDVEVREHGDAVITIGTHSQEAAFKGNPADGDFRISHVFVREGDRWAIASIQLSLAAPPAPPAA
jgi:ketosteroid isomerase-like protein